MKTFHKVAARVGDQREFIIALATREDHPLVNASQGTKAQILKTHQQTRPTFLRLELANHN